MNVRVIPVKTVEHVMMVSTATRARAWMDIAAILVKVTVKSFSSIFQKILMDRVMF